MFFIRVANSVEPSAENARHGIPVSALLDNVRSMYNVGAFFRVADGVGWRKSVLNGNHRDFRPKNAITKTALGAEETVPWEHSMDAATMVEKARAAGNEIVAIERACTGRLV